MLINVPHNLPKVSAHQYRLQVFGNVFPKVAGKIKTFNEKYAFGRTHFWWKVELKGGGAGKHTKYKKTTPQQDNFPIFTSV